MALMQLKIYTEEDYYNLSEDVRAEVIEGQIYYMSAPSRIHQEVLSDSTKMSVRGALIRRMGRQNKFSRPKSGPLNEVMPHEHSFQEAGELPSPPPTAPSFLSARIPANRTLSD